LFIDAAVAQWVLGKAVFGDFLSVNIASGIGLTIGIYAAGGVSGGHLNPAVSLAMSSLGRLPWRKLPVYMLAQYIGAFLASAVLYAVYFDALNAYDGGIRAVSGDTGTAGIWATFPAAFLGVGNGLLDQIVGTALLMLGILAVVDPSNMRPSSGVTPIAIGSILAALGMAFGMNFGFAVNPARDFAPRVFVAIAGWGGEAFSFRKYTFWIPILGPHIGAIVGAAVYQLFVGLHFPDPESKRNADSCRGGKDAPGNVELEA
ncbi:Aquaporin-10, partial [Lamellibrachia satsuma]